MLFAPDVEYYNLRSKQTNSIGWKRHPKGLFSARSYYGMLISSIDRVL